MSMSLGSQTFGDALEMSVGCIIFRYEQGRKVESSKDLTLPFLNLSRWIDLASWSMAP